MLSVDCFRRPRGYIQRILKDTSIPDDLVGPLGGHYVVEREIGSGGMATVYLARDLRHDRKVALKLMRPELSAILGRDRFEAEIRVTANLQHPNIVPLFDSGEHQGQLFYVLPYIEGESLRALLTREQMLPIEEAIRIAADVATALEYAHQHRIVHRDIKPENILLQGDAALVADFGIALAVSNAGGNRLTQTGISLGSPQYMSPEQATASKDVDPRTDVYSLGCVLYEMLAGEPPFSAPNANAIIARVLTEAPRPVRANREAVSPALQMVVLKAIAKLPADRFPSAAAFLEALRATTSSAGTGFTSHDAHLRVNSSRLRWLPFTIAAVGIAIGVAGASVAWRRPLPQRALVVTKQLTFDGKAQAAAISPDGKWLAFVAWDCPDSLRGADPCPSILRVLEIDGGKAVTLLRWQVIEPTIKWTMDGASLLFQGAQGDGVVSVHMIERLGGTARRIRGRVTAIAVDPDGRRVSFVDGITRQQVLLNYDVRTFNLMDSVSLTPYELIGDLSYSPSGDLLAATHWTASGIHEIYLLDRAGRVVDSSSIATRPPIRWEPGGSALWAFDVSETGHFGGDLLRIPVSKRRFISGGRTVLLGRVGYGLVGRFDLTRERRAVLVYGPDQRSLQVAHIGSSPVWRTFARNTGILWALPAFTPDGDSVVASASDFLSQNVYVFPLDGGEPRALTAHRTWRENARWSPDRKRVAFLAGDSSSSRARLVMMDADGGRERVLSAGMYEFGWITNQRLVVHRHGFLVTVDTSGAAVDSAAVPDSLEFARDLAVDPLTHRVFYWSTRASALVAWDSGRGAMRFLSRSPNTLAVLGWSPDRAMLIWERPRDRNAPSSGAIHYIAEGGNTLVKLMDLPRDCWNATVDPARKRVVCIMRRWQPDVWLAELSRN